MKRRTKIQFLLGTLTTIAVGVAIAHSGASGVVKQRMDLMEDMGESMDTLADMFKGKTPYDPDAVKSAAGRINELAGENIADLFPEGSLHPPSEALPEIWDDWQYFEELATRLRAYSDALVKAAYNPQQMPGAMGSDSGGGRGMMMGDRNMMGGANQQGTMMGNTGSGMMGNDATLPDPEHLATMPPRAAFMHLADTCNDCHTRFRQEKDSEK